MTDLQAVQSSAVTSDERIRNVLRRLIRKAYDRGDFSRASLAEDSGVSIHQIDQIVSHDPAKHRRVAAEDALCLAYSLGEQAVSALVGVIGFTASRRDAEAIACNQIVADILPHISTIAQAAADGRIDHTEAPMCREAADQIISKVVPLSSAGKAA